MKPEKIGKYSVTGKIGQGAMGVVYQGRDPLIERTVAIKTIRFDTEFAAAERDHARQRFIREARSAGNLSHPHIVTIYEVGEDAGLTYIAMEYVSGRPLDDLLTSGQKFTLKEVVNLASSIGDALDYAHSKGVIHRDVKPGNILVDEEGRPHLVDFGIARISASTMTQTRMVMGTPFYMSPEQIAGKTLDGRSDVFSLGAVIYELLTHHKPFPGDNITTVIYKIINEDPPPARQFDRNLPEGLDGIIRKALAKNPEQRFHSCREFVVELKRFLHGGAVKHRKESLSETHTVPGKGLRSETHIAGRAAPAAGRNRRALLLVLASMMIVVLAVVILVGIYSNRGPALEGERERNQSSTVVNDSPDPWEEGQRLWRLGDYEQAEREFEKILSSEPRHSEALILMGLINREKGDFEQALIFFERALGENDRDSRILLNLAEIRDEREDYSLALDYYRRARAAGLEPEDSEWVETRITEISRRLEPQQEQSSVEEVEDPPPKIVPEVKAEEDPEPPPKEEIEIKDREKKAEAEPEKREPEKPSEPDAEQLFQEGVKAFREERFQDCLKFMQQVRQLDPTHSRAAYYSSLARRKLRSEAESQEKVIETEPEVKSIKTDPEEKSVKADQEVKKVEMKPPADPTAERIRTLLNEGRAAADRENYNRAVDKYRAVLALDPGHQEARNLLNRAVEVSAPIHITEMIRSYTAALEAERLRDFYQQNCTSDLFNRIRKDAELTQTLYDNIETVASRIQVNVNPGAEDRFLAEVRFTHIITGIPVEEKRRQVILEGVMTWILQMKENVWKIMEIKFSQ